MPAMASVVGSEEDMVWGIWLWDGRIQRRPREWMR